MTKNIWATAPVRIDISAGWSDANPFQSGFGGAVLNAAINLRVKGSLKNGCLSTCLDNVPANSGLGTSGALRTVYLVVANPCLCDEKIELIKRVHIFENAIVGQRAGYQDQAAAVFGGVNYWEFKKDGKIIRKNISRAKTQHLYNRLVLVYTGDRHQSSNVHEQVFGDKTYIKKVFPMQKMKIIAKQMYENISNEKKMTALMNETWLLQKSLHNEMETKAMQRIQRFAEGNYLACRATGAGGGGCMLFYTKDKCKLIRILKKMNGRIPKMRVLPFEFDYKGLETNGSCVVK